MKNLVSTARKRVGLCILMLVSLVHWPAHTEALRHVRVAIFDTEPLVWYDAQRHRAGGIYVHVLEAAARREGWSVQYVPADYSRAMSMLDSGEVDLVPHVPDAADWSRNYALGREPVVSAWGQVYAGDKAGIGKLRDLTGKRIAVVASSALHEYLIHSISRGLVSATVQPWATAEEAARAVSQGRADAVLLNQYVGTLHSRRAGLRATGIALPPFSFRIAARKGLNADLLQGLDRTLVVLKSDPDSVYFKELQAMAQSGDSFLPPWIKGAAAVTLILFILGAAWAYTLRRAAARLQESERQQRELAEELTRISDRSLDVIAVLDEKFRWVRVSRATERLWGYTAGELLGRSCLELMPTGRARDDCREVLEKVFRGEALHASAARVRRSDGTIARMLWSLTASQAERRIYAIGRDDSERSELIAALRDQGARLTLANEDLRTFTQSVSHDLRTPVAAVTGFAGKVLRDEGGRMSPKSLEFLSRVVAAGERMEGMIVNLLQLARLSECGLCRATCDVTAIAVEIVEALRQSEPNREVRITITPAMSAWADGNLLHHLLENLIANAWKFTARTPQAVIAVGCDSTAAEPVFFVTDNGAGFDMEFAQQLFRPFSRLHSQGEFTGTGIGLSIAQRVVTGHGGRLWAQGEPNRGAVFRFTLGQARCEDEAAWDHRKTATVA